MSATRPHWVFRSTLVNWFAIWPKQWRYLLSWVGDGWLKCAVDIRGTRIAKEMLIPKRLAERAEKESRVEWWRAARLRLWVWPCFVDCNLILPNSTDVRNLLPRCAWSLKICYHLFKQYCACVSKFILAPLLTETFFSVCAWVNRCARPQALFSRIAFACSLDCVVEFKGYLVGGLFSTSFWQSNYWQPNRLIADQSPQPFWLFLIVSLIRLSFLATQCVSFR